MDNRMVAKQIAEESIVLLKNKGEFLPLEKNKRIAFFGRAQIDTVFSGNGSGAVQTPENISILEECEKKGILVDSYLKQYYTEQFVKEKRSQTKSFDLSQLSQFVTSGFIYELFGKYQPPAEEYPVSERQAERAHQHTDTALIVLGRNSGGEECDRHLEADYYLTQSERDMVRLVYGVFEHVILVLNVNGLIDLSWTEEYQSIESILFVGIPGEEGGAALAGILTGAVNPSGKLAFTIAKQYKDYPSADHFSWDKEHGECILTYASYGLDAKANGSSGYEKNPVTVYHEDIYNGYRYFDTFEKEPLYAFGFGLSYTEFSLTNTAAVKMPDGITVSINVKNIGSCPGKEVVQIYLEDQNLNRQCALRQLKGFAKTRLLNPREEEQVNIFVPWNEFACYDEEEAAYLIREGNYALCMGNSSRSLKPTVYISICRDILTERCVNRLIIQECNRGKIDFLKCLPRVTEKKSNICHITVESEDIISFRQRQKQNTNSTMTSVIRQYTDCAIADIVKRLSVQQLAALCVGYGPGTPFAGLGKTEDPETIYDREGKPVTTNSHPVGPCGYVSPAIEESGIQSIYYKDGPAGVGETVWPTEMLISCAFNRKLWYEFGNAVGRECEKQKIDVWLAPAVNLHRNPLCGRNFEYFSEDPYLTGICACEITKGVQKNHSVLVCPKHFAVNEQESFRRGNSKKNYDAVDSIISERAARELYLKPFEMLVKDAEISCVMTSFNKINGILAGGSDDLCTHILREEWGYQGIVITDWGDMDIVVDGADAVNAGNDIIMPGGPPVIAQIMRGYQEKRLSKEAMETAVAHLLYVLGKTGSDKYKSHTYN